MPNYRKIFPSYDWDDVWLVNQIANQAEIVGKERMGFVKNVPNEEVKTSDRAVREWIDRHLVGCSCLVVFLGKKTHTSDWVRYEITRAGLRGMGRLIVSLEGMENQYGAACKGVPDPYKANGLYAPLFSENRHRVPLYRWIADNGKQKIGAWIEEACRRAGK